MYDYLDYDVRSSEDYVKKVTDLTSKNSVRRYVLPLELGEKVDVLSLLYITQYSWRQLSLTLTCIYVDGIYVL